MPLKEKEKLFYVVWWHGCLASYDLNSESPEDWISKFPGFDIKDYPGSAPMTSIFPMPPDYLEHFEHMEKMKGFARRAIEHYNEKMGTSYVVNEILKVNGHGIKHFMYYITLSVKNGENEYFQVKVVDRLHLYNSLEFPIVRPRAKGGLDI
ncbi:hypothetical protein KY284_019793 [Solanum tuberosum]|nr:hypothetical protein KY284_019793 [Solanum tuberosum]